MRVAILPERIRLPTQPHVRRHSPQRGTRKEEWKVYMDCLRWDFGFTCLFCMLHESDLEEHGAREEGKLWVEHFITRSEDESRADDYSNTFFSCHYCDRSRGDRYPAVDSQGRKLLDPTLVAWSDHFEQVDNKLSFREGDANAEYTWIAYKLDHPKKLQRRGWRRELITFSRSLLEMLPRRIAQLRRAARAAAKRGDAEKARSKLQEMREAQENLATVATQIKRFRATPLDAPETCRCSDNELLYLPSWLAGQVIELHVPDTGSERSTTR